VPKYFPNEEFVARKAAKFVPAMEALVSESPARFRLGLVLHIVLGYALFLSAVFAALLLSLLTIFAALVAHAIWLVGLALGSFISAILLLQSLHVVIPPPKGIPLAREDAPLLHDIVHRLAGRTGAPQMTRFFLSQKQMLSSPAATSTGSSAAPPRRFGSVCRCCNSFHRTNSMPCSIMNLHILQVATGILESGRRAFGKAGASSRSSMKKWDFPRA
jgi:hypothetical protein